MKHLAKRTEIKGLAKSQPSGAQPELCIEETRQRLEQHAIDSLQKLTGTQSLFSADRILTQVANALVWPRVSQEDAILRPAAAIGEMGATNLTEAMLSTQMLAVHDAALMYLHRSQVEGQTVEGADGNVLRATRLMRLFTDQLEAMQKLKGKSGQQKVTVEHVHVHEGGQAIVGMVKAPRRKKSGGVARTLEQIPHDQRRGRLKNGNPSGDFSKSLRCGAMNRRGTLCLCPAMTNGRCRLHGGLSTGPKTEAGLDSIRAANTVHGKYAKEARHERAAIGELLRRCREVLVDIHGG